MQGVTGRKGEVLYGTIKYTDLESKHWFHSN